GEVRANGRFSKEPFNAHTGKRAQANNPATWTTFAEAYRAYRDQSYDGVGFVLSADDPYIALDLDHVFAEHQNDPLPALPPQIETLITRFHTYTECSPSGTGLHLILALSANTNRPNRHTSSIEVFSADHFVTVTGRLLRPDLSRVETCQEVFVAWEQETFAPHRKQRHTAPGKMLPNSPRLSDEAILQAARGATNGEKFLALWDGNTSGYASHSEADLALTRLLAFYTQDCAQLDRLFRTSGLFRPKWDEMHGEQTYGEMTIEKALKSCQRMAQRQRSRKSPSKRGGPRSVTYVHEWQRRVETPEERARYLDELAKVARARVDKHLRTRQPTPLAIALPPGVGKTREGAKLGGPPRSLAWIAPRHDLYAAVAAQAPYTHIQPCTHANCSGADVLNRVAALNNRVWPAHEAHACAYYRQFAVSGSAFYVSEMVATPFPQRHEGAIIDELDLPSWIDEQTITLDDLTCARQDARWGAPQYEPVQQLLRALYETLLEARKRTSPLHALSLFTALDELLSRQQVGSLCDLLSVLERLKVAAELRPTVRTAEEIAAALRGGKVMVPPIVRVL
ncbi:MAG: hypothetical protein ACRDID_04660, partial [Ktedonobacterales bacterium]